jgi:hypothetical protein
VGKQAGPSKGSEPNRPTSEGSSHAQEAARKLRDFLRGFAAAVELDSRAANQGCFVESVCLTASLIDGFLRMGLILRHQLETGSTELLEDLLEEDATDSIVSERDVYRRALAAGVIDRRLFDELESLYKDRNRVVHRYVISAITTDEVLAIAISLDAAKEAVANQIADLEDEQVRKGVGMTRVAEHGPTREDVMSFAMPKHGDAELGRLLRSRK